MFNLDIPQDHHIEMLLPSSLVSTLPWNGTRAGSTAPVERAPVTVVLPSLLVTLPLGVAWIGPLLRTWKEHRPLPENTMNSGVRLP
jgi:hypothetical protein